MKPGNITTNNTDTSKADEKYMSAALAQAVKAYKIKEVPIGCTVILIISVNVTHVKVYEACNIFIIGVTLS